MKITAIELTETELKQVFDYLVSKFNTEDQKQSLQFDLSELNGFENVDNINIEAELKLSTYYSDKDENNQTSIEDRYCDFKMTFFYDGEEIKENCDKVFEMINKYYEI